jgi:glycosyltransferase involved in cell wall biosynthesis
MTGKNKWKSNVFKSYSKLVLKYNSKFHDGLTCISDALRDIYEKTFGFKLNENYHSWPSGVNLSQFVSERKLSSKEESNHINMIFHGSITSTRGLQNAVHGLNEYRKFNSEFTFYIYGGGSFQDKLAGIVNELDLNDHVKFMGTVPPEDIPGIIDTMDLAIMTYPKTMYWEGNVPLKILEYIAMKIPVICSRLNVFEQITDGYDRCIFVDEIDPVSICNGLKEFEKKKVKFLSTDINVDPIIEKYTWENIARDFERYLYKMTAS